MLYSCNVWIVPSIFYVSISTSTVSHSSQQTMASLEAARKGEYKLLQEILRDPTKRESKDEKQKTPLIIAAEAGHVECVRVWAFIISEMNVNWKRVNKSMTISMKMISNLTKLGTLWGWCRRGSDRWGWAHGAVLRRTKWAPSGCLHSFGTRCRGRKCRMLVGRCWVLHYLIAVLIYVRNWWICMGNKI